MCSVEHFEPFSLYFHNSLILVFYQKNLVETKYEYMNTAYWWCVWFYFYCCRVSHTISHHPPKRMENTQITATQSEKNEIKQNQNKKTKSKAWKVEFQAYKYIHSFFLSHSPPRFIHTLHELTKKKVFKLTYPKYDWCILITFSILLMWIYIHIRYALSHF